MPSDFTALNAAIATLTAQVEATKGTEASASALISGFAAQVTTAVTAALQADDAADQGSITAATDAITATATAFHDSEAALGAAVAANGGTAPVNPSQP